MNAFGMVSKAFFSMFAMNNSGDVAISCEQVAN
jgi:hypothetical protein